MPKFPRIITHDLIQFAKALEVKAHYWDPKAKSAFEFARQMASPKLKKKNPNFSCNLVYLEKEETPSLKAQFLDGSQWTHQELSEGDGGSGATTAGAKKPGAAPAAKGKK